MLSSDRPSEQPGPRPKRRRAGDRSGRRGSRTRKPVLREQVRPDGFGDPWDAGSAEALTRLYESEEGRLWRPAPAPRLSHPGAAAAPGGAAAPDDDDRTWLEAHLTSLAERLQATLARADPEPSLAQLNGRLEAIEQRFGTALGRVAQRTDFEGLRSIETHVLDLAGRLEQARERLERIGSLDEEVRTVARKLDESGEQRANALEKLLRDCIAEWREGEERTAGALHNLEEAVARLGDTVDAMEAFKPALDLSVPPLAGPDPGPVAATAGPPFQGGVEPAQFYHATLDAADYAPRQPMAGAMDGPEPAQRAALAAEPDGPAFPAGPVEWSPTAVAEEPGEADRPRPTPGALQIMAVRARLRGMPPAGTEGAEPGAVTSLRRASLSLLLLASAAFLAGSTYLLFHGLVSQAAPLGPALIMPGPPAASASRTS